MRFLLAFILGTVLNVILFGAFTVLNGTPVPSVHTPMALLTYPTGSVILTVLIAWVIYSASLGIVFLISPRKGNPAR